MSDVFEHRLKLARRYVRLYDEAMALMERHEDLEPTSAFKQVASDAGLAWGEEMGHFVKWAHERLSRPNGHGWDCKCNGCRDPMVAP